jgi:hypothetical protein
VRKFLTLLTVLLLSNTFLITPAQAVQEIVITEPTHRLSDGVFFDDELATKLNPTGELGLLIYSPSRGARSWLVDPATLSEIVAMSNGYVISDGWEIKDAQVSGQEVAKAWLAQFLRVSRNEKISVLTYGNPSKYWVDQLFENQITYINASGKISLEGFLGKATTQSAFQNSEKQGLSKQNINFLNYAQRQIDLFSTLVDQKELLSYQLRISQLLNPDIEKNQLQDLIKDLDKSITQLRNKLKITKTKFTITSSKEELPITLVNDFQSPINLKLSIRAINSKVVVTPVEQIQIEGNSKQQVLLPVEVLATGESSLLAQLTNLDNKPVGYPVSINLKLSVISPVATWITSAAAVLLFVAALIQSLRRVKRRK